MVTYKRKVEFVYGNKMDDLTFRKLGAELQKNGLTIISMFRDNVEYGFKKVATTNISYDVFVADETVGSFRVSQDAREAVRMLEKLIDKRPINSRLVSNTTAKKQWKEIFGDILMVDKKVIQLDGSQSIFWDRDITYELEDDEDVKMNATFNNSNSGLKLTFEITWKPEKIQRKDAIEEKMVDLTLNDIATFQKVIEKKIKLKKFGSYDINEPTINCKFDAMTHTSSECAPDIIQKVRDAKKGL